MNLSKRDIIVANFLGGLAWGLGTVVGATIIAAALIYSLNKVGIFNILGPIVGNKLTL